MKNVMKSTTRLVLSTLVFLYLSSSWSAAAADVRKIEGAVVDAENQPVRDVWVRVYGGATENARGMVGGGRRYEIEFESGGPIAIRYDHLHKDALQRLHSAFVRNISGSSSQRICKVLAIWVGSGIKQQPLLDILASYERVYTIDAANADLSGVRLEVHER